MLYGNNLEKAQIDIIGSSISLASKIVSIAKHNQVLIGESIYNILLSSEDITRSEFIEIKLDSSKWKYLSHSYLESMYRVYEYIEN